MPLSVTYACMPSSRRDGIESHETAPNSQRKINDRRISIRVIENSRGSCMGGIDGVVLMGPEFLAQLARGFRAPLPFTMGGFSIQWVPKARLFHKTERRRRHPEKAIGSLMKYSSVIADLSFLLQNMEWLVHRQGHWVPESISQTVDRLASVLTPLKCRCFAMRPNDSLRVVF